MFAPLKMGVGTSREQRVAAALRSGQLEMSVCEVRPQNVTLLQQQGISNTVVLFADLLSRAGATKPIVAKMWLAPAKGADLTHCPDTRGLDYEARVYQYVTEHVAPQAPFFVTFLGFGVCHRPQVEQTWGEFAEEGFEELADNVTQQAQTSLTSSEVAQVRRNVTDPLERAKALRALRTKYRDAPEAKACVSDSVHVLLTLRACTNCAFSKWIATTPPERDVKQVLIMVLYALLAMRQQGVTHNDLHMGNILVRSDGQPLELHPSSTLSFSLDTHYWPVIFDWDHAYVAALGPNPFLTEQLCSEHGACNALHTEQDLYAFFCRLVSGAVAYPALIGTVRRFLGACQQREPVSLLDMLEGPYFQSFRGTSGDPNVAVYRLGTS